MTRTLDDIAVKHLAQPCEPASREVSDMEQAAAEKRYRRRRRKAAREGIKAALRQAVPVLSVGGLYLEQSTDALLARLLVAGWRMPEVK